MAQKLIVQKLANIGQSQVLRFFDRLDAAGREKILMQLESLDLPMIAELVETQVKVKASVSLPKEIQPVKPFRRVPSPDQKDLYARALARGRELLHAGKVAAFLVAGGQGTRLGYDGPKGEYPVTPVKNKPLFQVFAEQLLAHSRLHGATIPWYIMTSEANDAATRAFFHRHSHFGYREDDVFFFQQGMMPAFAFNGEMLLAERDSLALSPDGHGGSLRALFRSGALADMQRRGIEH
ncbi:MAG: UTP--glucose-1-phosphate uridylyltransferase, partial [Phycisphaerae bacterium]|nr:UTP--glucose-1-phosphate uridylyltransferase [Phycisphaerae bacterium]MDW8262734.1 UTP--glucose-1-phosphate uridylyltransferase [Phycisphaerales bacterium]